MKEGDTVVLVHVPDMCDVAAATGNTYFNTYKYNGWYLCTSCFQCRLFHLWFKIQEICKGSGLPVNK